MAEPGSPPSALIISDRPLSKKLVEELRNISSAMGLDISLDSKKDKLVEAIQPALRNDVKIANDPRFLPLLAHRSRPTGGGKTSADKATEEAVEAAKPQLPATGAHHALLVGNVKTDLPGQYKKLAQVSGPKERASSVSESGDDSDSTPVSPGPQSAPQTPEVKPRDMKASDIQEMNAIVQVNFFNERNFLAPPRQVYVDHPVNMSVGDDGQRKYVTQFSQLIPAAVEQDSPIKARGGRSYRPNIGEDCSQHLHIGTIDAVLAGNSRALQPTVVNEYIMHHSHDGLFSCDLFWDNYEAPGDGGAGAGTFLNQIHGTQDIPPTNRSISDVNLNPMSQMANYFGNVQMNVDHPVGDVNPVEFHNMPEEKPLDIARNRAAVNPMHKDALAELRAEFAQDLHMCVKTIVPDLPDYGDEGLNGLYHHKIAPHLATNTSSGQHLLFGLVH